ncbi:MAG: YfhO family protein [Anaerolineae bacterium]
MKKSTSRRACPEHSRRINVLSFIRSIVHSFRPSPLKGELLALLFLLGATALFFWPVWIAGFTFPEGGGDLFNQLYPVWSYMARWVRRGIFPLWHTGLQAGDPIIAEAQYGLFNVFNWPLFLFDPLPHRLLLVRGAFSLLWAGWGLYLYLRYSPIWRLQRGPALFGAVAYMFSNPFVVHLGHPQFNDVMAWLPWVLLGLDNAMRRSWLIPMASAALAGLVLAGHGQAALYALIAITFYALWQILEGGIRHAPRRMGRLILVALLGALLATPSILPGFERLPMTERALVPQELRRGYEFPAAMWVDFITPDFHGQSFAFWPTWNRVESGYVGAVALILAALGLLSGLRQRRTWFLIGLGAFSALFAVGYEGPLYPALARLPMFAESWKTARIIYLISFVLAQAAAAGMAALINVRAHHRKVWIVTLFALGAGLWLLAPTWTLPVPAGLPRTQALTGLRFAALLLLLAAVFSITIRYRRRVVITGLICLLLVELIAVGALAEAEPRQPGAVYEEVLDYLRSDPGWFRVDVDASARGLISPSGLQAEGFEVPQGTGNPMELFAYNQFYWAIPYKGAPAYRLLGAKYIIVSSGTMPGGEGIIPVFTDDPQIDLHLNTRALPRAWLVYRTQPIATIEEAYEKVLDPNFAPDTVAVVENGPSIEGPETATGNIGVLAYTPNHVKFSVQTSERALLVLSDFLYPGWQGFLDGKPAPIHRTNVIFRGMIVPAGTHEVEMRFRPLAFRQGLGLAGMAGLVIITSIWVRSRKKRN